MLSIEVATSGIAARNMMAIGFTGFSKTKSNENLAKSGSVMPVAVSQMKRIVVNNTTEKPIATLLILGGAQTTENNAMGKSTFCKVKMLRRLENGL